MQVNRAFTLIEMTIVLIIIGLIAGVVVSTSSVVHGVKLKNVILEFDRYKDAIEEFKNVYHAYPGDYKSASDLWSTATDGDGDWIIEGDTTERLYAWHHLVLAQLISGAFSGATGTPNQEIGYSVPGSDFKGNLFMVGTNETGAEIFGRVGTSLQYTANASSSDPYGASLDAKDAYAVDVKMDDGVANSGDMFGVDGSTSSDGSCSDAYGDAGADYDLTQEDVNCRLVLWLDY